MKQSQENSDEGTRRQTAAAEAVPCRQAESNESPRQEARATLVFIFLIQLYGFNCSYFFPKRRKEQNCRPVGVICGVSTGETLRPGSGLLSSHRNPYFFVAFVSGSSVGV